MNKVRELSLLGATTVGLIMMACPVLAQGNATTTDAPPTPAAEQGGIADIVVTARKREERLQDVPVAITAFSGKQLERYASQSLSQISAQTPQLQIGTAATSGGAVINLRGIGSVASGVTIDQAVSLNLDGVQVGQTNALRLGLHDLDRIEVLKGPQALFFGKNSPAGVISILSTEPTDRFEVKVRTGYEFYAEKKFLEGAVSGPLTSTLRARLYAYYGNQNGWFRNDAKPSPAYLVPPTIGGAGESTAPTTGTRNRTGIDSEEIFVRGTLVYTSGDQVIDAKLKVSHGRESQKNGFQIMNQLVSCPGGAPTYVLALGSGGSRDCKLDRYNNEPDIGNFSQLNPKVKDGKLFHKISQTLVSGSIDFHLSDKITLSSITGFYDLKDNLLGNISFGDLSDLGVYLGTHLRQVTQEVRLSTDFDSRFNLLAGAYYQNAKITAENPVFTDNPYTKFFTNFALAGPAMLVDPLIRQKTESWSAFGQARVDITSEIQVTAGARYTRETKRAAVTSRPNSITPFAYEVVLDPNKVTFDDVSPEATIMYKPDRNLTFYASYREGFKSGGFDLNGFTGGYGQVNAGDISFRPETVRGFEIGAKGAFAGRQIVFDLSLYRYKYRGLQVSALDPAILAYRFTNAGSAVAKGVEFALQYQPNAVSGLNLHTSINYNIAQYSSFENAPCYSGQSQAAGCNVIASRDASGNLVLIPATPATVGNAQGLNGRPLARAPKWTGSAGVTYEADVSGDWKPGFSFDAVYSSPYYSMPELDPRSLQRKTWRLNAAVNVRSSDDRWQIALIGTNLTNTLRALSGASHAGTGSGTGTPGATLADLQGTVTEPRAVTLQATFRY